MKVVCKQSKIGGADTVIHFQLYFISTEKLCAGVKSEKDL